MTFRFLNYIPSNDQEHVIDQNSEVPDEMNVFFRDERDFLPEGKVFSDLTEEEKHELQNRYRFSPYKPGQYQGITWIAKTYKQM